MTFNRLELIKQILNEKGYVSFKELSENFPELSVMTLRRDIERLEFEGFAIKIRGGAKKITFSKTINEIPGLISNIELNELESNNSSDKYKIKSYKRTKTGY